VLSGGTGSAKFLRGLCKAVPPEEVTVIVNVGDNTTMFGLYICPDVDTITYALSGILDEERGWGIRSDSFNFLSSLRTLGLSAWFNLGDKDLATHVYRTMKLKENVALSQITHDIAGRLGVRSRILPATDDFLETRVLTDQGEMHLQEFWVRWRGAPAVKGIVYLGADRAKPAAGVEDALASADTVILAPANPITSIGPILAVKRIRETLQKRGPRRVAVSPLIGRNAVSGPAGKIMSGLGLEVSPVTLAKLYCDIVDTLIIHTSDENLKSDIEKLGIRCVVANILMRDSNEEKRLANHAITA